MASPIVLKTIKLREGLCRFNSDTFRFMENEPVEVRTYLNTLLEVQAMDVGPSKAPLPTGVLSLGKGTVYGIVLARSDGEVQTLHFQPHEFIRVLTNMIGVLAANNDPVGVLLKEFGDKTFGGNA